MVCKRGTTIPRLNTFPPIKMFAPLAGRALERFPGLEFITVVWKAVRLASWISSISGGNCGLEAFRSSYAD
jgi:hypothetical protein